MDYPRQGCWQMNYLENDSTNIVYFQSEIVPSLWKHKTRLIQFALMVDDFGVKYAGREHAEHRKHILKEHYKVTADWTGE